MATYFVGQRVRLVVSKKYLGITGRISAVGAWREGDLLPHGFRLLSPHADCVVDWERPVTDAYGNTNRETPCTTDRIEPILPSGHRAGDFSFSDLMDKCREGEGIPA